MYHVWGKLDMDINCWSGNFIGKGHMGDLRTDGRIPK
jgi:hypothetical protein